MSDFETWIAGKKAAVRYDIASGWWMSPHAMRGLVARAEKAEAQVERVRELIERETTRTAPWRVLHGGYLAPASLRADDILRALDGPA